MKLAAAVLFLFAPLAGCTATPGLGFGRHFTDLGIEGSILIIDEHGNRHEHGAERNRRRFLPASTFKILNSLIALETGVITPTETIAWDGKRRSLATWNRDLDLGSAIGVSAVWFYQILARRIGATRMQRYVSEASYGNADISGDLDSFWLGGALRISAEEQVTFLRRLRAGALPFSAETVRIVKDILVVESPEGHTLRAKSGWAVRTEEQVGWYVGYAEGPKGVAFFATNIVIRDRSDLVAREAITRRCLRDAGYL